MCQERAARAQDEAAAARERAALSRQHLFRLVGDLASAPPQTTVRAFREENIIYKGYEDKVQRKGETQQQQQQQRQHAPAKGAYLGGLYSAPRGVQSRPAACR